MDISGLYPECSSSLPFCSRAAPLAVKMGGQLFNTPLLSFRSSNTILCTFSIVHGVVVILAVLHPSNYWTTNETSSDNGRKPENPLETEWEEVVTSIKKYFDPTPNIIVQRFKFTKRLQMPNETISEFITALKKIVEKCEFPDLEDRLRDTLVCGILNEELQSMLLMNSMLTFKVAQEMALAHEAAVKNVAEIKDGKPREEMNVMGRAVKVRLRDEKKILKCFRCGNTNHREEQCFFKDKRCFKCQKLGHISRVCKNGNWRSDRNNCSIGEEAEATNGLFNVNQVKDTSNMRNYMVRVQTSGRDINMLIDSGTGKNIISEKTYIETWVKSERPRIEKDATKLVQWNRQRLSILGKIRADVKVNKRNITMELLVVEGPGPNLIGREAFDQIGIGLEWINYGDSVCQITEELMDVFKEKLGQYRGPPVHIKIKTLGKPTFLRARTLPYAIRPKVEEALRKIEEQGILTPVEFTRFATPIVPVLKRDGSIRICGDYRSTVNTIVESDTFPVPAAADLQVNLAGEKVFSKLNLKDAYQQLVVDEETAELLANNTHKGLFKVNRLPFGVSCAPGIFQRRMESLIAKIPGVVVYLDDIPVTGKDEMEHDLRLREVLKSIQRMGLTLKKEKKPLVLACDASPFGVGAVLSHVEEGIERPIAFASRTMSQTERRYAQIEKEALAIIFGISKFYKYLYGRDFKIITDHKPLLGIFNPNKPIPQMLSPRMMRWSFTLASYSYQIEHRPGRMNANADALSRAPHEKTSKETPEPVDVFLMETNEESPLEAKEVAKLTQEDSVLGIIVEWTRIGWPDHFPAEKFRPYFNRRNELSLHRECLLWGNRVVIPPVLQRRTMEQLHETHLGIVQMKAIARSHVWWPGMDRAIENRVKGCENCQLVRNDPKPSPVHPWTAPVKPWSRIHIDYAGPFHGRTFLIVVDSMSKWPEAIIMDHCTATATVRVLRNLFAVHGLPDQVVSDNGRMFVGHEFQEFLMMNGIRHITSAPYHPQTNGQAERVVQTLKQLIRKNGWENISVTLPRALFAMRTTPHGTTGLTPAELLMGRRLTTRMNRLHPKESEDSENGKEYFQNSFKSQENVYARKYNGKGKWEPGKIKTVLGPRNYEHPLKSNTSSQKRYIKRHFAKNIYSLHHRRKPSSVVSKVHLIDQVDQNEKIRSPPQTTPSLYGQAIRSPPQTAPSLYEQTIRSPPQTTPSLYGQTIRSPPQTTPSLYEQTIRSSPQTTPSLYGQAIRSPPQTTPSLYEQTIRSSPQTTPSHYGQAIRSPPQTTPSEYRQAIRSTPQTTPSIYEQAIRSPPQTTPSLYEQAICSSPQTTPSE
ncbi:K02A2.6-like [Cordylochernes scorpioides]|uniref:RNA-directed DNA polymerase n=1 Tax=Cordylochernes scorpioides TaxID=51811 RepID=A0ABY6LRB0_9ARAC|nr:K02A2.6-like [Cordylochernes scorpioides]